MRRPRRHKYISAGIYFLIYAVLIAVSQKTEDPVIENIPATLRPVEDAQRATLGDTETNVIGPTLQTKEKENEGKDDGGGVPPSQTSTPLLKTTLNPEEDEGVSTTTSGNEVHTLRPRRINCTAPAIEQFPNPLMGPKVRRHGGLVVHILLAVFSFLGLAIVCDDYFVSSLDRICEEMKLSPDVAGATFMAAGSSAPELATVIIGVFFAKDDIGISGVIGSAVFNIMFVISVCALCSNTVSYLNWWPLVRDCVFYAISILVMLFTISNEVISWPEALIMLLMYVVYCVVLHFNSSLERWAMSLKLPIKLPTKEEQASRVTYKSAVVPEKKASITGDVENPKKDAQPQENTNITQTNQVGYNTNMGYDNEAYYGTDQWDPNNAWGGDKSAAAPPPSEAPVWDPSNSWDPQQETPATEPQQQQPAAAEKVSSPAQAQLTIQATGIPQSYYRPKEYKPEDMINPLVKPTDAGKLGLVSWYIVYPIHFLCRKTMPDCKSEKYRNWYPFTFLISMIWISFYSYIMVWMITIIGSTLGIPDTVMGLTFVAAGVSVPDALSSIAVIKEGYGDMAVSNAVGSNVFDILICLGLPWFIQTAIIKPGSHVNVISKGLTYSTLSLLSTVIFLVLATHLNGWKLDRKYGIILMIWYLIFITFASLYELNVFGDLHFPECESIY